LLLAGRSRAIALAVVATVATVTVAAPSFAQTGDTQAAPGKKPKKKKPKGAEPAATEAPAETAPPAPTAPETPPAPAPEAAPAPAPAASDTAAPSEPPTLVESDTEASETPARTYYFVGLRHRVTVIPQFMVNLFVNEGSTFVSWSPVGLELDIRRDDFSLIPFLTYTSYGFGDTLFWQKNSADVPQNYSDVNSGLSGIYLGADLLWSKKISKNFDFEYGAGFGLGVIFGSLTNDWVYQTPNGPLVGGNKNHYTPCATTNDAPSCQAPQHQNSTVNKVGGYQEPNWLQGGSIPVVFPYISIPQVGIRWKPIRQYEMRFTTGFSLTGFF
jgi:hypothetical protein